MQAKGRDVAESGARHGVIQPAVCVGEGKQELSAVCQALLGRLCACLATLQLCVCKALGERVELKRVARCLQGRAAWPIPSQSCDSSCCALCQAEASELSAGAREAEQAMGASGLDTHMGLERAHAPANSTGASAGSVEAGSGPRAATSASHSCEGSLKRSAEEAAAVALEAGAGEVSGGVARMVHGYASSSNLSASTEVEERVPVRSKRVRLMRLTGGAAEACTGDSEAQPSCSARYAIFWGGNVQEVRPNMLLIRFCDWSKQCVVHVLHVTALLLRSPARTRVTHC